MNSEVIAAALLQLVALGILSTSLLLQALRTTDSRSWRYRRFGFGVATMSIGSFVCVGIATVGFLVAQFDLAVPLKVGLFFTVLGLTSFLLFTGALYDEHRIDLGRE